MQILLSYITLTPSSCTIQTTQYIASYATIQFLCLLQEYVPSAHVLSSAGAERSFRLPFPAAPFFPALLDALDAQGRTEVGVTAFGLSVTTLEEVFLRVGADVSEAVGTEATHSSNNSSSSSSSGSSSSTDEVVSVQGAWQRSQQQQQQRLSLLQTSSKAQLQEFEQEDATKTETVPLGGWRMFLIHFSALFRKRLIYGLRSVSQHFVDTVCYAAVHADCVQSCTASVLRCHCVGL
jgi:hypothetical protein